MDAAQFKYYGNRNSKNENYQIWTNNNHPEECFTKGFTDVKTNYIHQNPVRAGIVRFPEDYIYSSAANYAGKKGIIDIEVLDWVSETSYSIRKYIFLVGDYKEHNKSEVGNFGQQNNSKKLYEVSDFVYTMFFKVYNFVYQQSI